MALAMVTSALELVQDVHGLIQQEKANVQQIAVLDPLMEDLCGVLRDVEAEMINSPWADEEKLADLKRAMDTITDSAALSRELISWYNNKGNILPLCEADAYYIRCKAIRIRLQAGLHELSRHTWVYSRGLTTKLLLAEQNVETALLEMTRIIDNLTLSPPQHVTHMQRQRSIPYNFLCPISQEVMVDPVRLVDSGCTFEREMIVRHLEILFECPITGVPVTSSDPLAPNDEVRDAIQRWQIFLSNSILDASAPRPVPSRVTIHTLPTTPPTISPPDTTDLIALQSLLQAKGPTPPNLDLEGRTVTGQLSPGQHLVITQPGTVLSNGQLVLPPGVCISVMASARHNHAVMLKGLTVSGQGSAALKGLVDIQGIVVAEDCMIKVQPGGIKQQECSGVAVHSGGLARFVRCKVSSAAGHGFVSNGTDNQLTVQECTAVNNRGCGFAALFGGMLWADGTCVAINNKEHGFYASGVDSRLTTEAGCSASINSGAGFRAANGGALTAGANSSADNNKLDGFEAQGQGSSLMTGDGCSATGNGMSGFCAVAGGVLTAGASNSASSNNLDGFEAQGEGSKLIAGDGCSASSNGQSGFSASAGVLTAGAGSSASDNKLDGFQAQGLGAKLTTGGLCSATSNSMTGFSALAGGVLTVGANNTASDNKQHGIHSEGEGSQLITSYGCLAPSSGGTAVHEITDSVLNSGSVLSSGGSVPTVGADSSASNNKAQGLDSDLIKAEGSSASSSGQSGVGASVGVLDAGADSSADDNKKSGVDA